MIVSWIPSLGNFLLGTFAWELSLENLRVGTFASELLLGIFCMGTFARVGFRLDFLLGNFPWELSFGNFRLGSEAWGTGLLRPGEPANRPRGNRPGHFPLHTFKEIE